MKRRQFLIASAGVVGSTLPLIGRAQSKPCPPPLVEQAGGQSVTTTCGDGSAPAWFTSQAERTWVQIAGGSGMSESWQQGSRIFDVKPDPMPPGGDGINAVHNNWTGGCASQASGEYYLPAQGGHSGYYGNEIYALALREAKPSWKRIWGPTPNTQIQTTNLGYNPPNTSHADGSPRPTHGWFYQICDSKSRIWHIGAGYASPGGEWGTTLYSIDRNNLGAGWTFHGRLWPSIPGGRPGSTFGFQSGPCAYDRSRQIMWVGAEFATNDAVAKVDLAAALAAGPQSQTTGPAVPGRTIVNEAYTGLNNAWSVVLHDRASLWVVGRPSSSQLWILDPSNPSVGFQERATSGSGSWSRGCGAVYVAAHKRIYVGGTETGAVVRYLTVPTDPLNGTWTWTTLTNGAGSATPTPGYQYNGTFSKLQVIEDMGNGQAALVLMSNVQGPSYVYKLPSA